MVPLEFATVALLIAISQIGYGIGALGVDTVINRYSVNVSWRLFARVFLSATVVGLLLAGGAFFIYELSSLTAAILFFFCVSISLNQVASAYFRSRQRFGLSLLISQVHNAVVAVAAIMVYLTDFDSAAEVCSVLTGAYMLSASLAWRKIFREKPIAAEFAYADIPWAEGLSIVGAGAAIVLLIQLDRLLIPNLLGVESLATFAVLAAIVGSSFRILQMGIGYTLLPRLRSAETILDKRRLMLNEGLVAIAAMVLGITAILALLPLIVDLFLADKYELGAPLVIAAICAGLAKVFASFFQASATALGSSKDLVRLNVLAWLALAAGVAGAIKGSDWGLPGLIYGVGGAWMLLGFFGAYVVAPHLRDIDNNS
jgi:O-antigen/teichoic acid export membrane protein